MVDEDQDPEAGAAAPDESTGLSPDRGDILTGFALVVAALVLIAIAVDIGAAAIALAILAGAYVLLGLVLSLLLRDLSRGFIASVRWTVGFLGRWFSFW